MVKHIIYAVEPSYSTWQIPTIAIPVETEDIGNAQEMLDLRDTGYNSGLTMRIGGAKPVNGGISFKAWQAGIASWISTILQDVDSSGASDPYTHAMLVDESIETGSLSIQKKLTAALGHNILSAKIGQMVISVPAKGVAVFKFTMEAKDEVLTGGTWEYDGSAAPAIIASPVYAALARPYIFSDSTINIGGTPSIANNKISIATPVAYPKVSNVEITFDVGLDADGYGNTTDKTRQEITKGDRGITVTFDISWTDYSTTLIDAIRSNTAMAFEMALSASANRELNVVIPSFVFDPNELPPTEGANPRQMLSLTAAAQYDPITAKDFNLWLTSAEATI